MADSKLDAQLRSYLEDRAEEKAKGITLESLHEAVKRLHDDRQNDRITLSRYGRRLRRLEQEAERRSAEEPGPNWEAAREDITGTWQYQQIHAELERRDSDHKWLKRQGIQWIGAAVGAFVMALVSAVVAFATAKLVK